MRKCDSIDRRVLARGSDIHSDQILEGRQPIELPSKSGSRFASRRQSPPHFRPACSRFKWGTRLKHRTPRHKTFKCFHQWQWAATKSKNRRLRISLPYWKRWTNSFLGRDACLHGTWSSRWGRVWFCSRHLEPGSHFIRPSELQTSIQGLKQSAGIITYPVKRAYIRRLWFYAMVKSFSILQGLALMHAGQKLRHKNTDSRCALASMARWHVVIPWEWYLIFNGLNLLYFIRY